MRLRPLVDGRFPPDQGRAAADVILGLNQPLAGLEVDLHGFRPESLISAFFSSFLQRVFEVKPELVDEARKIKWRAPFPFQEENIQRWMSTFQPYGVQEGHVHLPPSEQADRNEAVRG